MSRTLDNRLSKLEAKRNLADDNLSRLTDEELTARIDVLRLLIEAERTGQLAETRARLMTPLAKGSGRDADQPGKVGLSVGPPMAGRLRLGPDRRHV